MCMHAYMLTALFILAWMCYIQFRIIYYQLCTYIAHCSNSPEAIRAGIFKRTEKFLRLVTTSQASLVNTYNEVCIVHSTYICTYVQMCVDCHHLKCIVPQVHDDASHHDTEYAVNQICSPYACRTHTQLLLLRLLGLMAAHACIGCHLSTAEPNGQIM